MACLNEACLNEVFLNNACLNIVCLRKACSGLLAWNAQGAPPWCLQHNLKQARLQHPKLDAPLLQSLAH